MTPREQAIALLLLQEWRDIVETGKGNLPKILAQTVHFLTVEIVEEPAAIEGAS